MIENFAQLLAEWRWLRDFSQVQLGRACGVDATYISKLENGQRAPTADVVARLATALTLSDRETALFYLMAGFAPPHWRELFGLTHLRTVTEQPLIPQAPRHLTSPVRGVG